MSHLEVSRIELKVIEGEPVPLRVASRPIEVEAVPLGQASRPSEVEAVPRYLASRPAEPGPTDLLRSVPRETAITTTSQASCPIVILEEVELPQSLDPRLVVLRDPNSAQARSYRLLQHRLLAHADPRVIAVTSAWPSEGKTTCAANLALTLADETFARVLLIEANTKRPGLAQAFGFSPADSFISRLVQERDSKPPYLVARVRSSRLHVAALVLNAAQGMRLDRLLLGLAISELREHYQYIVIDAGSVFDSADADVAGECADGVIVTARAGKSRQTELRRAIDQLSPTPVLGVVLLDA